MMKWFNTNKIRFSPAVSFSFSCFCTAHFKFTFWTRIITHLEYDPYVAFIIIVYHNDSRLNWSRKWTFIIGLHSLYPSAIIILKLFVIVFVFVHVHFYSFSHLVLTAKHLSFFQTNHQLKTSVGTILQVREHVLCARVIYLVSRCQR